MEAPTADAADRRLLLLGALFGMLAIIALPLTQTIGTEVAPALVFATPIVLVLAGAMRRSKPLLLAGAALALLLGVLLALAAAGISVGPVGWIAPLVLLAGPVVAVVAVGLPLRETDLVAGAAFLGGGTIAVMAGFLAAATAGATSLVLGVGLVAFAAVAYRLGQQRPADAP
ncbi:MAG: hypothetical protein ACLFUG_09170 [Nitriliruptoraceae bacterium]